MIDLPTPGGHLRQHSILFDHAADLVNRHLQEGATPVDFGLGKLIDTNNYRWEKHCRGLYQHPVDAQIANSPCTGGNRYRVAKKPILAASLARVIALVPPNTNDIPDASSPVSVRSILAGSRKTSDRR